MVSMLVITAAFVAVTISVWGTEGFGAMVQLQCPFAAVSMAPMTFISPRMLYEFRLIGWSGHYIKAFEFVPMLYLVLSLLLMLILCRHYLQVKRK